MSERIDLAYIADRTGLSSRKVRYAAEHGLLPGRRAIGRGRGVPRSFLLSEATVLAVAAFLVEARFGRGFIREILRRLARATWAQIPRPNPLGFGRHGALVEAAESRGRATLEVGDGHNLRLSVDPEISGAGAVSTGWLQIATGARLDGQYEPMVVTSVNLGQVRDSLR